MIGVLGTLLYAELTVLAWPATPASDVFVENFPGEARIELTITHPPSVVPSLAAVPGVLEIELLGASAVEWRLRLWTASAFSRVTLGPRETNRLLLILEATPHGGFVAEPPPPLPVPADPRWFSAESSDPATQAFEAALELSAAEAGPLEVPPLEALSPPGVRATRLAELLLERGQTEDALRIAALAGPSGAWTHAEAALAAGDRSTAVALYTALRADPERAPRAELRLLDLEPDREALRKLALRAEGDEVAKLARARQLERGEIATHPLGAIESLGVLAALGPDSVRFDATYRIARLWLAQGQPERALDALSARPLPNRAGAARVAYRALERRALRLRAGQLLRSGALSEAQALSTTARQAVIDDPETALAVAAATVERGELESALPLLREASERSPRHPDLLAALAEAYRLAGFPVRVAPILAYAEEMSLASPALLDSAARAAEALGDDPTAERHARAAFLRAPDPARAFRLSLIAARRGDPKLETETLLAAAQVPASPFFVPGRLGLAVLAIAGARFDEALDWLDPSAFERAGASEQRERARLFRVALAGLEAARQPAFLPGDSIARGDRL